MRRTLEAIFRRPLQLLRVILPLPLLSLTIVYIPLHAYRTTACLWALHRYEIIGDTGSEGDLVATPAETRVTALSELLQSRTFDLL